MSRRKGIFLLLLPQSEVFVGFRLPGCRGGSLFFNLRVPLEVFGLFAGRQSSVHVVACVVSVVDVDAFGFDAVGSRQFWSSTELRQLRLWWLARANTCAACLFSNMIKLTKLKLLFASCIPGSNLSFSSKVTFQL